MKKYLVYTFLEVVSVWYTEGELPVTSGPICKVGATYRTLSVSVSLSRSEANSFVYPVGARGVTELIGVIMKVL